MAPAGGGAEPGGVRAARVSSLAVSASEPSSGPSSPTSHAAEARASARDRAAEVAAALRNAARRSLRTEVATGVMTVLTMRGQASFDSECLPAVFLDGVFLFEGAVELERTVSPSEVMGIEVYAGPSTVPAEFQLYYDC